MSRRDEKLEALTTEVAGLKAEIKRLRVERDAVGESVELTEELNTLKRKLADAKIDESRQSEKFERDKRETEHMVGLERKRQEFEIDQARREAMLEVNQANLSAKEGQFAEQMKFMQDRLTQEVTYLKDDILKVVLDRLPTVTVDRNISEVHKTKSA